MKTKTLIQVGVMLAAFATAGYFSFQHFNTKEEVGGEDSTEWVCQNCSHEFKVPRLEIAKNQNRTPGWSPACPQCGQKKITRGIPCVHCGRLAIPVGHGELREKCKHCGKMPYITPP